MRTLIKGKAAPVPDGLRDRIWQKIEAGISEAIDELIEELEAERGRFAKVVAARRGIEDRLRALESRAEEVREELRPLPQQLGAADLAADREAEKRIRAEHKRLSEELKKIEVEKEKVRAKLSQEPGFEELAGEMREKATQTKLAAGVLVSEATDPSLRDRSLLVDLREHLHRESWRIADALSAVRHDYEEVITDVQDKE